MVRLRSLNVIQKEVIQFVPEEYRKDKEKGLEYLRKLDEEEKANRKPLKTVVEILPGVYEETLKELEYKQKRIDLGLD